MADDNATVRINVPIDRELHRALRLRALDEDSDLRRLVPKLLREAMGLPPLPQPEEGKKGGVVYAMGGLSAMSCADRKG